MSIPKQEHGAEKLSKGVLQASLAKIAEIVSGFGFPKHLQGKTEGELPFFKVGDISKAWNRGQKLLTHAEHYLSRKEAELIKTKVFPKGTVVFAKIGEAIKLNRRAILGQPSIVDNNVMGLIPCQGLVDTLYLYYYMLTVKLGDISQATTVPSVRKSDVEGIAFPLVPIEAQKCIVAEIEKQFSRLDEAVANLRRVKANLKRYKAAVLKAAVEGKLTEDWRKQHPDVEQASKLLGRILAERRAHWEKSELARMKSQAASPRNENWKKRYKDAEPPKSDETYEIPRSWAWTNLGQLSWSVKDGPHYSPRYSEKGIPFISGGNIRPEGIDFSTPKYISPELHKELSERCKPEYGDLLYTKGGTTGIARINTERREFNVWVHVAVLKLVDSVKRLYLQQALNSPHCYRQSQKYTHGVGNQDLGLTRMIWITVPLPPLQEQEQIVDEVERRLSVIEKLTAAVEANILRAERLRQSILQQAFAGKLKMTEATTTSDLGPLISVAEPQAPYATSEEIFMRKSSTPLSTTRPRELLDVLKAENTPIAPEQLFTLCGFDSTSIEQVERFYAKLNELVDADRVEEFRPSYDRVSLRAKE